MGVSWGARRKRWGFGADWRRRAQRSGPLELSEDVVKQGCGRVAARQRDPYVPHRDANQRPDLQQFQPQRPTLGWGQFGPAQSQPAQGVEQQSTPVAGNRPAVKAALHGASREGMKWQRFLGTLY
ncbi:MAG: hypothetical protein A3H27_14130 [Acidobacteria bacterium RIFCSPLOWO2_02_FULL_59_13]|nr:MAG: hypothetical protein A3H27_14130 [Acidobacteria bacterium RIFCSPLOWO2_02_FULL_59_13]